MEKPLIELLPEQKLHRVRFRPPFESVAQTYKLYGIGQIDEIGIYLSHPTAEQLTVYRDITGYDMHHYSLTPSPYDPEGELALQIGRRAGNRHIKVQLPPGVIIHFDNPCPGERSVLFWCPSYIKSGCRFLFDPQIKPNSFTFLRGITSHRGHSVTDRNSQGYQITDYANTTGDTQE